MDEETLDYLLKKAEVELHEGAQIKSGVRALLEAMKGVVEYMQQYKKDLADAQAHQQSKERRRQERLAESEEGFENPYESRCENGQENREVQGPQGTLELDTEIEGWQQDDITKQGFNLINQWTTYFPHRDVTIRTSLGIISILPYK